MASKDSITQFNIYSSIEEKSGVYEIEETEEYCMVPEDSSHFGSGHGSLATTKFTGNYLTYDTTANK